MPTPMPVTIDGWSADVGARLELAWTAALLFGVCGLVLGAALVLTVLVRR
jgi:hypothetical protein